MNQPSDSLENNASQNKQSPLDQWLLTSGNFFFRFRNGLFPLIYILLVLFTKPALFLGDPRLDRFVVAFGIAIALLGQGFRLLVIGFAYIKRGGKDRRVYADDLVDQGLYAHTRNPMYVGNLLILSGVGIVYGSPWIYFFVIPFFLYIYLAITAAEENYLKNKFGAVYEDYQRRVNRFWPNLRGIGASLKGYRYDWKKALRKEYGTVFVSLTGLVLVNIWKLYS
ncbi:MAG: isoprenylcysteine carboxylmethyltransferase family protein, partial [Gammaproteobacteria bacterium]